MRPSLAQTIALGLAGHRAGNSWMARCPAHDDSTPSLSIKETGGGKLLALRRCRLAGCGRRALQTPRAERLLSIRLSWPLLRVVDDVSRSQSAETGGAS